MPCTAVIIHQTIMGEVMSADMIPLDNQDAGDKRISICSDDIGALTQIYDENVNIAIWRRHLPAEVVDDPTIRNEGPYPTVKKK